MAAPNKSDTASKQNEHDAEEAAGKDPTATEQENANRLQADLVGARVHGDTTSSNGAQNAPGYHGRDGGVAAGTDNNPAAEAQEVAEEETGDNEPEEGAGPKVL